MWMHSLPEAVFVFLTSDFLPSIDSKEHRLCTKYVVCAVAILGLKKKV